MPEREMSSLRLVKNINDWNIIAIANSVDPEQTASVSKLLSIDITCIITVL